jgi:hypothetical protein
VEELDRVRAAALQPFSVSATTTGDEPLTVDLVFPQAPDIHYIVETAALMANLVTRQPNTAPGFPPLTGLFLVPVGTAPETTAEATAGWVMGKRGMLLPLGPPGANVATIAAGPPYAYALTLAAGFKINVQYGYMLRAIVTCAQGSATPGPGAGSIGILTAFATRERNVNPLECA